MKSSKLVRLKRKAMRLYVQAQVPPIMNCDRGMAELLKPEIQRKRLEFSRVWKQVRKFDPDTPEDPFKGV